MTVDYITVRLGKKTFRVSANSKQFYRGRGFVVIEGDEGVKVWEEYKAQKAAAQKAAAQTTPEEPPDKPIKSPPGRKPKKPSAPIGAANDGKEGGETHGDAENADGAADNS